MTAKLVKLRQKILAGAKEYGKSPGQPVTFALFLLEVLDEKDFETLDAADKADPVKALQFLEGCMKEVAAMATKKPSRKRAAG